MADFGSPLHKLATRSEPAVKCRTSAKRMLRGHVSETILKGLWHEWKERQ